MHISLSSREQPGDRLGRAAAVVSLRAGGTPCTSSRTGESEFINNYHALHGRTAYTDGVPSKRVRRLKRLWLETDRLTDRPPHFSLVARAHWAKRKVISRLDATR